MRVSGVQQAVAYQLIVVDAGPRPCSIGGLPQSLRLLVAAGGVVAAEERALDSPPGSGVVELVPNSELPPPGGRGPRGSAQLSVAWRNWCGPPLAITGVLVVLPLGGSITAATASAEAPAAPPCNSPGGPSTVQFDRFQPAVR